MKEARLSLQQFVPALIRSFSLCFGNPTASGASRSRRRRLRLAAASSRSAPFNLCFLRVEARVCDIAVIII